MTKTTKRYSTHNIHSHPSKRDKNRKYHSSTSLDGVVKRKNRKIRHNFRKLVRRFMTKPSSAKEPYLVSFLNIIASCEELCSRACVPYVPSIENMISHRLINGNQEQENSENQSYFTFTEPISSSLLEGEPEIPVYFLCLLERVLKMISCPLTRVQNQMVIKGTWNILIKYSKDNGQLLYKVNEKVEWGLLELLSFKFEVNKKERFDAEERLRLSLNEMEMENESSSQEGREERTYFCTLQHIE